MVGTGKRATIATIHAGRGLQGRLYAMGLTPGESIRVLSNGGRGPLTISVRDTRVALGYGMASKIFVEE
jgi:Fe2+ transport system protein FeoA